MHVCVKHCFIHCLLSKTFFVGCYLTYTTMTPTGHRPSHETYNVLIDPCVEFIFLLLFVGLLEQLYFWIVNTTQSNNLMLKYSTNVYFNPFRMLGNSDLFFLIIPTTASFLFCHVRCCVHRVPEPCPGQLPSLDFSQGVLHQVSQCRLVRLKVHRTYNFRTFSCLGWTPTLCM